MGEGQDNKSLTYYFTDTTSGKLKPISKIKPIKESEAPIMSITDTKATIALGNIVERWYIEQSKLLSKKAGEVCKKIYDQDEFGMYAKDVTADYIDNLTTFIDDRTNSDYDRNIARHLLSELKNVILTKINTKEFRNVFFTEKTDAALENLKSTVSIISDKLLEHKNIVKTMLDTCECYDERCEVLHNAKIMNQHYQLLDKPCDIIWCYNDLSKLIPEEEIYSDEEENEV
jgi:hypothetical protein